MIASSPLSDFAGTTLAANRYWDANGTAINRGGNGAWEGQFWSASSDGTSSPYGTLLDVQQLHFA